MIHAKQLILFAMLLLLCSYGSAEAIDPMMEDYTAYPAFIASGVQPNILIILDNSGSMNNMAYGYHYDGTYHPDDFGAVVTGTSGEGSDTMLVDANASFTDTIALGDIVHNVDDGACGTVTGVNATMLEILGGMSRNQSNDANEHYWIESQVLKNPASVEEGYYGYFVPTARYTYSSNVFVRNDTSGEWSGSFLNWLTMRRVDVSRKVLMGGLATARTGGGNQHLIGETPGVSSSKFIKLVSDPSGYSPYNNRHFYKIADGYINVYKLDQGDPDLDYTKDFTLQETLSSGDDYILADYDFDYAGNYVYEIRLRESAIRGNAVGGVDSPIDDNSSYRYYLYDPNQNFNDNVRPGDLFVNENDGSSGYVSAVPESVGELLNALGDKDWILYDMFHDAGADDSWVGYPDRTFLRCQDDIDFSNCEGDGDLEAALQPLIGHIVIFSDPLVPYGPHGGENYHFERTSRATRIARMKIEVARDQTMPDEARDFLDGNISGVLQKIGDRARFGLEFYNTDQGGKVVRAVGSNMTDLITQIENTSCNTSTPLAESLYEGIRYYQQVSPYYGNDYGTNNSWDPFYFQDLGTLVECPKSFILQITDGEPTMDQDIPEELQAGAPRDYDGDGNDPGSYPNNGSDYLDDVALWGHTTDLRADLPNDLGPQNINYYAVFAFGRGSRLLQDAAINGGFWDLNDNDIPDDTQEWDRDRDGLPDTYYEAPRGFELEAKIYQAITDILKRAASGTAVSVLSTSERGEGTVYQAYFKPQMTQDLEDIKWLGYLQCLWVDHKGNMREDTVNDGRLVLSEDKIIRYRFDDESMETIVDRYTDADGNGDIDNIVDNIPQADDSMLLENFHGAAWEVGEQLALRTSASRQIITFADLNWDGVVDSGEQVEFTTGTSDLSRFESFLDVVGDDSASYAYLGPVDQRAENLVQFIRGEQVSGLRNRQVPVNGSTHVWKLGDIVTSTPAVVTRPRESFDIVYQDRSYFDFVSRWKDRQGMIYIGANDGMLHAFKAGRLIPGDDPDTDKVEVGYFGETDLGTEEWAYVPFNLLPHLKWLANPEYTHVYYVDLKMKVTDVKIFSDDDEHTDGWGTLLVGGMRLGGGPYPSGVTVDGQEKVLRSAYFLIDVTNPEDPEVLAELSHPQMGFSTSYPTVTKVGDHWFLIVGSGPTPGTTPPYNYTGTSNQVAKIFVLDLSEFMSTRQIREGQELHIFPGPDGNAFLADPISVDMPTDYSIDVIYVGESYWASSKWQGGMLRLQTNGSSDPSGWQLSTLFRTPAGQSITSAAAASVGFDNDLWVYFGTGRFYNDQDKASMDTQSLYGIHDPCIGGGSCNEVSSSSVLDLTDAQVFSNQSVTNVSGVSGYSELEALFTGSSPSYHGWKINLQGLRERCLTKPIVLGGAVFFTSFMPDPDICSIGGDGKLYGLYFLTGTAHYKGILGQDPETGEALKSVSTGKGMPATLGMHAGTQDGATGFVQTSTGNIVRVGVNPPLSFKSGTVSWWQQ